MQYLGPISKTTKWSLSVSKANHSVSQLIHAYAPNTNAEKAEVEWFYDDLQNLLEQTLKKDVLFIEGDWNSKVGLQEIPGVTGKLGLWIQNEAGQRLTVSSKEHTGHSKHPLPTTQEITIHIDITRWSILKSNWLYSLQMKMDRLYIVSKSNTGSWLWLRSWTPYCQIHG